MLTIADIPIIRSARFHRC